VDGSLAGDWLGLSVFGENDGLGVALMVGLELITIGALVLLDGDEDTG
jgi:hypothetical protein